MVYGLLFPEMAFCNAQGRLPSQNAYPDPFPFGMLKDYVFSQQSRQTHL